MNGAGGGAAMSTVGLICKLAEFGVEGAAVCHDAGSAQERDRLLEACNGRVVFTPLYVWNKKIRAQLWKRPLIEVRQLVRTGAAWGSSLRVFAAARRFNAALLHTNTLLTVEGGVAAARLRVPHVWHVRELTGAGAPFRLPLEAAALGDYLSRHATMVVANSEASAVRLRPWLPRGLLEVIENGIDVGAFSARQPAQGKLVVGMVANLTSRTKKHALFIDAIAALPRSIRFEARIYGHGAPGAGGGSSDPYVAGLVDRVRSTGLDDRFAFAGFVEHPEDAMRQIDVLVHPADNESFGRVVLEAWAAGVPVVGVSAGGVGAIVTDGIDGLLARPNDSSDLADKIAQFLADAELRRRMGRAGRRTVERRFSLNACARRVATVYETALHRGPARWARAA